MPAVRLFIKLPWISGDMYETREQIRELPCSECGASAGERCWSGKQMSGERVRREKNHAARMELAQQRTREANGGKDNGVLRSRRYAIPSVEIVAYAIERVHCLSCGSQPGTDCVGEREEFRSVCKSRFMDAAVTMNRAAVE